MYTKDSKTLSTLWGRTGASILTLLATGLSVFGYFFGEDMQMEVYETVGGILAGVAFLQISASKIRESKKVAEADKTVPKADKTVPKADKTVPRGAIK